MGDYSEFNQVIILITSALPNEVSVLEQTNTILGTWYAALDLINTVSLISHNKDYKKQFAFHWWG